ncbi:MAG TPA: TonB family protein [Steroidobacteraceae bacterium]|jgi:TonB family protein|nr:TonB family protein [Steroidobacteraceae bacterium]
MSVNLSDSDGPAMAQIAAGSGRSCTVIALSHDAALLEALTLAAVGRRVSLVTTESTDQFVGEMLANADAVVFLDAAVAPIPLLQFVAGLRSRFPAMVLLVAGSGHQYAQLAPQLAAGGVYRFLHKPASSERMALFLDAAMRRRDLSVEETSAVELRKLLLQSEQPIGEVRSVRYVVLAAIILACAAAGAWLIIRPSGSAVRGRSASVAVPSSIPVSHAAAVRPAPPPTPGQEAALEQILGRADGALAQGKLTAPDGSGAGELYRLALQRSPGEPRARQGLDRVVDELLGQADRAAAQGRLEEEAQAIDAARALQPDSARTAVAAAQFAERREADLLEQLHRVSSSARSGQAQVYVQLARKRLGSGDLIEPAADSARDYLQAAMALAPDDGAVGDLAVDLRTRMIAATRRAIAAGDAKAAARWLDACRSIQVAPDTLAALSEAMNRLVPVVARSPAPVSGVATGSRAAGSETMPGDAGQARAIPLAPAITSITPFVAGERPAPQSASRKLKRTRFVAPTYPDSALARGITGWVELEYTVTTAGTVRDIKVDAAQPEGVFDAAARSAVAQWRFKPLLRDGTPVESRVHVRVSFVPR